VLFGQNQQAASSQLRSTSVSDVDLSGLASTRVGSRNLHGYLAKPSGVAPWPGMVMIHEAFGLDAVMRRQAVRLAAAGYLTLAVDLFSAGGAVRCLVSTMRALMTGHGRAFADIQAARDWLVNSPECTGRIGVIGFCMGGGFALLTAASGFEVASVNYGPLPRDLDSTVAAACPVVGSYGGRDRTLGHAASKLEEALTKAGIVHDVKEYPTAGHAFLNDAETGPRVFRPLLRVAGMGPEPSAAADAWRRIEDFFANHLRYASAGRFLEPGPRPMRKRRVCWKLGAAWRVTEHITYGPLHVCPQARPERWVTGKGCIIRGLDETTDEAVSQVVVRALTSMDTEHLRVAAERF
jgi:carboxymethylenebutenolidase